MTRTRPDVAADERAALADLLDRIGPDAPTLCEGWTTRDLAAHLVVRDRRPDAAPGAVLPALAPWTDRVRAGRAALPWPELVGQVRQGPPAWSPLSLPALARVVDTVEMYVHHEDVRRGADGWEPRGLDRRVEEELWGSLRRQAPLAYRRAPVGVVLRAALPGSGRPLGEVVARRAGRCVLVEGPPSELLLHATGRGRAARVRVDGAEEDVQRLAGARVGL
ncbi:TIGR03085 family metal-binding protein [Vallicoccus soli]|uniref:TIGR03085 family protein n=1 Tax=Vallicoccus soli TaxID=2339232 RepID=A0A3A3YXC1_9ACTN|nr:TIGR03085 family metal-binding protein [Vallicoccus soli]RJK93713.1 TIGR03085 family protein [Vallicoccus soli]